MTVAKMMFGFGDIKSPRPETVSVMEEIIRDYVQEMVRETVSWHRLRFRIELIRYFPSPLPAFGGASAVAHR